MALTRIIQYLHRPNNTELGLGNTHETYMVIGSEFDMSNVFPPTVEINVLDTVLHKRYKLKASNPSEFRVNQMGDIYRDHDVKPGDELFFTFIIREGISTAQLEVRKKNGVIINTASGRSEIINEDRLSNYKINDRQYRIPFYEQGEEKILTIIYRQSKKKRKDSPDDTDYFEITVDGETLRKGYRFLLLEGNPTLFTIKKEEYNIIEIDESKLKTKLPMSFNSNLPIQQITYGAPGTGKSYMVNNLTKGRAVIRTTFHPDSDYSTFVGAYKPIMIETDARVVPVVLNNGAIFEQNVGTYKEKRISYKFVKQAFLKAYLAAWKKYVESIENLEPQFLIIEEINRGNCAQIFGDLFQLLDRNDSNNFSTYPIEADADLQQEINNAFKEDNDYKLCRNIDIEGAVDNYYSNYNSTLSLDVQEGRVLLLPPNLYIWATMNTSDQSLFPIDSAFKRRWKWDYVKISNAYQRNDDGSYIYNENQERIPLGWQIKVGDKSCDWWQFIQAINEKIASTTISDDKKIGYFFCKPVKGTNLIDEQNFVGKVIFYLWNDVFKDNDTSLFKVTDTKKEPSFDDFYVDDEQGFIVPNINAIVRFLINVMGEETKKVLGLQENQEAE